MTPTPIIVPQTTPGTPVMFTLEGTGDMTLESVNATFDGAGAAGDFDAVLSVYTQDGKLLSRTKPNAPILAGNGAVVTWGPFLKPPPAAAAGLTLGGAALWFGPQNPVIVTATPTLLHFLAGSVSAMNINQAGGGANNFGFSLPDIGTYLVMAGVSWPSFAGQRYLEIQIGANVDHMHATAYRQEAANTPSGDFQQAFAIVPVFGAGGATVDANVYQASGAPQTITDAFLYLFQLWPFPFP